MLTFAPPYAWTEKQHARLRRVFEGQFARGLRLGAQWVIVQGGRVAADLHAGYADPARQHVVTPHTPFLAFSVSKPFTAFVVHQLAERGQLDLHAPVAVYWPEFAQKGKEKVTVWQVLAHQAGIPTYNLRRQVFLWPDWERVTRQVAAAPLQFPPGARTAYHTVNFGFILGEVVRRVTGQPIGVYLEHEIIHPLGLRDTRLTLPDQWRARAAQIQAYEPDQFLAATVFAQPAIRHALIPGASLNSTARDLAVFFQMLLNGGEYAGRRYAQPETVARMTGMVSDRHDDTLGYPVRWGLGVHLGGHSLPGRPQSFGWQSTPRTFGHIGQGSTCMAWADPDLDLVVAFTSNRLHPSPFGHALLQELSDMARAVAVMESA